jgi:DNA mismatch endonuclease (patch repair protein)
MPKTHLDYWRPKLEGNRRRDLENVSKLERLGWRVLVVWECETVRTSALARRLMRFLR